MGQPDAVMDKRFARHYASSEMSYPADVGNTDDLHSYMKFGISEIKPIQHLKSGGSGVSSNGGNTHTYIKLYVPEQISVNHEVTYKQDESRLGMGALRGMEKGQLMKDLGIAAGGLASAGAVSALDTLAGSDGLARESFGLTGNAAQYQLLEGTQFRQFEFQYKFVPKNDTESQSVKKIVQSFRGSMMPEIDTAMFFYKVPDTFMIEYWISGQGQALHKFKPCVLTSCQVSYGGDGAFGIFHDGTPAHIEMSLTFLELLQVTKTDVMQGGF